MKIHSLVVNRIACNINAQLNRLRQTNDRKNGIERVSCFGCDRKYIRG